MASPLDLRPLSDVEMDQLAEEIRQRLCEVLGARSAHFASNLGVVELCLALHAEYDFRTDRLIWDTGHQIYPHKIITGRADEILSIRSRGGLMGFPNPAESPYDLFMTGHAGSSLSTVLGLKSGDDLLGQPNRKSVAVIGDGAFPSGVVFEAMNNAAGLEKDMLVVLNDNKMSICPRVGGLNRALDKARMTETFHDVKRRLDDFVHGLPLVSGSAEPLWNGLKDLVKANFFGGMLFEEMGFHYVGPIDGHDLPRLRDYVRRAKEHKGPVLLHVLTEKGYGVECARQNPVLFHAPPVFEKIENGVVSLKPTRGEAYTSLVSDAVHKALAENPKAAVITAAMCQGNKLEKVRTDFPEQFFDVGICEAHAVAFAAGMAKAGGRPIISIYSTFLQRAFDHIFQEVALQNLPVVFCLDRAGFTGPDGPTHHGNYDVPYMRIFPNMVVMAPGDELDVEPMLKFAMNHDAPTSLRYPKATPERIDRTPTPIELGQAEVVEWGADGCVVAFGSLLTECATAAAVLRDRGYDVGLVNARFAKPLDKTTLLKAVEECPFVVTVEEGCLQGGFGSALLEAANEAGVATDNII
ncbi:MAG: 1-deoxy-D-xylulose-5-phosphate synthase, partial [Planctomycetia bacterium]